MHGRIHLPAVLLVAAASAVAAPGSAETIFITTAANELVSFDTAAPGTILSTVSISGLQPAETLLGIDFRPASGQLYALGSSGRLYTLSVPGGSAAQVGSGSIPLTGSRFGFDFNPTVDRIRVVSDQDQNLRLHPDTGAVAFTDTSLAFAAADANAGDNPTAVGAAYTNNLAGVTTTTLYDIDLSNNVLVTQSPPNNGTLNTVGPLGVAPASQHAGFDISGATGQAYAVLDPGTGPRLYAVSLLTGGAVSLGAIGVSAAVTGMSIALSQGPCVPSTTALCLNRDRFRVTATWRLANGSTGSGQAIKLGRDSGFFTFFNSSNVELTVKVLDACGAFGRYWAFSSGLTNVGVTLRVEDKLRGTVQTYENPVGRTYPPILDTQAFDTCP